MNQEQRRQRLGMLFVAGAAILFASKGLFAKALYQRGVGFELLVAVRAVLAVPLFAWFAVRANATARNPVGGDKPPPIRPRAVLAAVIAGITCYYVGAMVDFWALTLIDASIERVLLFSFPAIVVLIGSVLQPPRPGGWRGRSHGRHLHRHFLRHGRHRLRRAHDRTCSAHRWCSLPRSQRLSTS